jgi:adenylate cyclase
MVGDTVNIAARLEAGTKDVGAPILVSQATAEAATSHLFVPMGNLPLKGRTKAAPVLALHANKVSKDTDFDNFLELHRAAVDAITQRLPTAVAAIKAACATRDGARYAAFYEGRLKQVELSPEVGKNPGGS